MSAKMGLTTKKILNSKFSKHSARRGVNIMIDARSGVQVRKVYIFTSKLLEPGAPYRKNVNS